MDIGFSKMLWAARKYFHSYLPVMLMNILYIFTNCRLNAAVYIFIFFLSQRHYQILSEYFSLLMEKNNTINYMNICTTYLWDGSMWDLVCNNCCPWKYWSYFKVASFSDWCKILSWSIYGHRLKIFGVLFSSKW